MILLIYIFGVAWFSNLFCWHFEANWFLKLKEKLNCSIIYCSTCFSFYLSMIIGLFLFNDIVFNLMLSFVVSFVAKFMEDKYLKF